jgi:hypothetical protein
MKGMEATEMRLSREIFASNQTMLEYKTAMLAEA